MKLRKETTTKKNICSPIVDIHINSTNNKMLPNGNLFHSKRSSFIGNSFESVKWIGFSTEERNEKKKFRSIEH